MKLRIAGSVLAATSLLAATAGAQAGFLKDHPNALWHVVQSLCVRDMRLTGRPAPCLVVNRQAGFAVVPDPAGDTQVLLVPTARLRGIESPRLLVPRTFNYWQLAWSARTFLERRAGRPIPRDMVAMAVNSARSRSQDQLHIHVDCVRADVRQALQGLEPRIGTGWRPFTDPANGTRYRVRRLAGGDLGTRDPFKLLVRGVPRARSHMAAMTLVVVGAEFSDGSPGFFLLASGQGNGFGEGLLDHRCAVLRSG